MSSPLKSHEVQVRTWGGGAHPMFPFLGLNQRGILPPTPAFHVGQPSGEGQKGYLSLKCG